MKNRNAWVWAFFLSGAILLTLVLGALFGGLKNYQEYRHGVSRAAYNLPALRFFIKEYLTRTYFGMTVDSLPSNQAIPSFYIYADEVDLASLDSELPSSGKTQTVAGHIKIDEPAFTSTIDFRYRGGLPMHWLYDKKSIRVRLPPYTTFLEERQFNLVNPSTIETVTDHVSYDMSKQLGLLTPDYFPARLFINNQNNGLHYFLSKIDESFLRKNRRMPGSIYSGDTFYVANPFGVDNNGINNIIIKEEGESPHMWKDERLWEKDASRNAESNADRSDIKKFIEMINEPDPIVFMRDFGLYFDVKKQYLYFALDTITGTYHHDNFHNHKIYFDPYKGRFEPIEWDIRFWSNIVPSKDLPIYPLLRQVKLNPILEFERDKVAYELMDTFSPENVAQNIDDAYSLVLDDIKADPFRHAPDNHWTRFSIDKVVPYSMKESRESIDKLKKIFEARHGLLKNIYASAKVDFVTERIENTLIVKFSVEGNSPVVIDLQSLMPKGPQYNNSIFRYFNDQVFDSIGEEVLYPGRKIKNENVLERVDAWASLAFGDERIVSAPHHYEFRIKSSDPLWEPALNVEEISVKNAITQGRVVAKRVGGLSSDNNTDSVHPWALTSITEESAQLVQLAGEVDIDVDTIFEKHQTVSIAAGSRIKLAKGRSLIFYGKVIADGSKENPIIFERKDADEPWGSVVIHGAEAEGSQLNYVNVSGGSVVSKRLVNYPGQLNIHDVPGFTLSHCIIENNSIGDDALHIAYSNGRISDCVFRDTAFDALDMDIVDVEVINSRFVNSGNDAIDLMTSIGALKNIEIVGAGDKCISVGEASSITLVSSRLAECEVGIAVKDKSIAKLYGVEFANNRASGASLYRKNPRYSVGGTILGNGVSGIGLSDVQVDKWSKNELNFSGELK